MFMKQYVEFNISKKSYSTTEYVLKMLASISETVIFMFMGLSVVSDYHSWNTGFILVTLISCTVFRTIGCFLFGWIANRWRLMQLSTSDMIIMSYGGIRGAMAFALVLILDENRFPHKKEFVTATIVVIFFTVFIQGTTIGPLVKLLNVKKKEVEQPTMSAKLSNRLIDHTMTCLEGIVGVSGGNYLRDKCEFLFIISYLKFILNGKTLVRVRTYDKRFLKPLLLRGKHVSKDQKLLNTFQKINEFNMNKIAEDKELVLRRATLFPTRGVTQNSKANELLENVMYPSPRRQVVVSNFSFNNISFLHFMISLECCVC